MARVELQEIKKQYENGYVAVHGANFTIEDGEFMVLVGPSGCGKSTTLRMIAGLETISSGTLRIGNTVVNDIAPKDRDIAMVFQNYALYPHMTVYENMAFGLKLRKFDKTEIHERVHNAAKILGIESMLDRKPKELSGGQRQRVAVGRAIVRKPKVFLFDEPLSNLDAKLRVQMRAEISKLHRQLGTTMVYVTHDQVEAMTMGSRIVVMKDGHIMQLDTPLNLYNKPANKFVAGFIGSPAMNFISGTVEREGVLVFRSEQSTIHLPVGRTHESALGAYIGKSVTLGIRPEDIYVADRVLTENETAPVGPLTLDVVEPMGNETFIYAGSKDGALVARIDPQELPDVGSGINLVFDLTKQHFFDNATELAIR